jgi:hypothetical protein
LPFASIGLPLTAQRHWTAEAAEIVRRAQEHPTQKGRSAGEETCRQRRLLSRAALSLATLRRD